MYVSHLLHVYTSYLLWLKVKRLHLGERELQWLTSVLGWVLLGLHLFVGTLELPNFRMFTFFCLPSATTLHFSNKSPIANHLRIAGQQACSVGVPSQSKARLPVALCFSTFHEGRGRWNNFQTFEWTGRGNGGWIPRFFFRPNFCWGRFGKKPESNSQPNSTAARFNNQTAGIQRFRGNVAFILGAHILDMMDMDKSGDNTKVGLFGWSYEGERFWRVKFRAEPSLKWSDQSRFLLRQGTSKDFSSLASNGNRPLGLEWKWFTTWASDIQD